MLKSIGYPPSSPGMNVPRVRVRNVDGKWTKPRSVSWVRPLRMPLEPGARMDLEIWEAGSPPIDEPSWVPSAPPTAQKGKPGNENGSLFSRRLLVPEWDIYLVILHARGEEAQRWFGRRNWIEAGWVSEYPPLAKKLAKAKPWSAS